MQMIFAIRQWYAAHPHITGKSPLEQLRVHGRSVMPSSMASHPAELRARGQQSRSKLLIDLGYKRS
jgi:hypothetical protein